MNLYLKIKNYQRYDDFYISLKHKDDDGSWNVIYDELDTVLDDRLAENDNKLDGVKLEFEIVSELPENIELP